MIERSDVALAAAVLLTVAIGLSYRPWRHLKCGHPFGLNPTSRRIDRCGLPPFHRGQHVRPWSDPAFVVHRAAHIMVVGKPAIVVRELCCVGHEHATLDDAITCSLGYDTSDVVRGIVEHAQDERYGKTTLELDR